MKVCKPLPVQLPAWMPICLCFCQCLLLSANVAVAMPVPGLQSGQTGNAASIAGNRQSSPAPSVQLPAQPEAPDQTSAPPSVRTAPHTQPPAQSAAHSHILLDPGHSSGKRGAMSCTGVAEYMYNNSLVHFVYGHLVRAGIVADVTRDPGGEASLSARAGMAKGRKLLISFHHDSAQPQFVKMVNGWPQSRKARGHSIFVSAKNPFFSQSFQAARILAQALYEMGLRPSTHHGEQIPGEGRPILDALLGIYQYDNLIVLKQAQSPALLLEAGVIIHPDDEELVRDADFQLKIATAVERAIRFALDNF